VRASTCILSGLEIALLIPDCIAKNREHPICFVFVNSIEGRNTVFTHYTISRNENSLRLRQLYSTSLSTLSLKII
jgi:hypothetical protein